MFPVGNSAKDQPMTVVEELIQHFGLEELPVEGGLFRQTYLSSEMVPKTILSDRYSKDKPINSAILYLHTSDPNLFSAMHKLPTDEIYHFYLGDPVELLQLYPDGRSERVILGHHVLSGQKI